MSHVVRALSTLVLACTMLLAAPAFAIDSGDIVIVAARGEVHITTNGAARAARVGSVLELPATLRTGRDGNIELKQGATSVNVGPETVLEFPALEKRGAPIDRILQPRGNAFYDIGKREGRKLRVETPYLVGVIKGTQFNVAAEAEATTISLFEGLLEVRATDESDVIDLKAGEIASRRRGDKTISVIKMDAGKAPPTGPRPSTSGGSGNGPSSPVVPRTTPSNDNGESSLVDRGATGALPGVDASADVRTSTSRDSVETGATVAVGVGAGNVLDSTANVTVNASSPGLETGAGAAIGAGSGAVDVAAGAAVDAGPVTAGLDTTTRVDVAAGAIDTATSAAVDVGPVNADVAAGAAVDLTAATVDTGVNAGLSTPVADVDLGATAVVDVASGAVDLGVDVANTGIDVGVDATSTVETVETVTETVTDTVVDVGGLLNGLFRRPGRK